jgi:hypothetical protein
MAMRGSGSSWRMAAVRRLVDLHRRKIGNVFGLFELNRAVYGTREGQQIEAVPLDDRLQLPQPRRSGKRTPLCSGKRTRDLRSRLLIGAKREGCGWLGGSGDPGSHGTAAVNVSSPPGWPHLGLGGGGLAGACRRGRIGIVVRGAQRGAVDADGDAGDRGAHRRGICAGRAHTSAGTRGSL